MSSTRLISLLGLGIVIVAAVFVFSPSASVETAKQPIKIKWLLSHQPTSVFARASSVFADVLKKESNGELVLSVVTPEDISWAAGDVPNAEVFKHLDNGDVQLATTYTVGLGKVASAFWSVNLPFLFSSYSEAGEVLDGSVGQEILDTASASTSAHALAFTMSGGYRIIVSKNTAIKGAAALKGLHIATSGGPVAEATLRALGAVPVPMDLENGSPDIDVAKIDGLETTYSRLAEVVGSNTAYTKYINETNHSMFLTTILVSDAFYNSLSPENQTALKKAALAAAKVEREDSIALGEHVKSELEKSGSIITVPTTEERRSMQEKTDSVYTEFSSMFGPSLIAGFKRNQ